MLQQTPHHRLVSSSSVHPVIDPSLYMEHTHSPARKPSIQDVSRRSSNHFIKESLSSRSRANSMAEPSRSSQTGNQHPVTSLGQDGEAVIADPMGFSDAFDFTQYDFENLENAVDFDLDFNTFLGDFGTTEVNNQVDTGDVGITRVSGSSFNPPNNYKQIPSFDQYGRPLRPTGEAQPVQQYVEAPLGPLLAIDPAVLNQQPQAHPTWGLADSTPGLTALPGAANVMPLQSTQRIQYRQPMYPRYPDPTKSTSLAQPYSYQPTGYNFAEHLANQQPALGKHVHVSKPYKRTRPESDSESEDDAPVPKRRRHSPQKAHDSSEDESVSSKNQSIKFARVRKPVRDRHESRDSGSSSSSLGRLHKPTVAHTGQKPQKSEDKPWVRINSNTKGETTRTARINNEAQQERKYKSKPLPHPDGSWRTASGKYMFEYTSHGGLDEFKKKKMSARQIMAYIIEYPTDDLRLWIQVSPADMARRYGSPGHSKCLFENCPKHVWGDSGTIDVGHYRVAFDEKFKAFGNKVVDPFDCAGFVHLYCLERFCDFERICRKADIHVDTRVDLPREIGQAKWTMSGRPETEQAQYFIKACKKDRLRTTEAFAQYPVHTSSSAPKQFDRTLVHALADINIASRTRSQMRQFVARRLTPNVLMINKGDMEIAMTQKKIKQTGTYKRVIKKKRATAATFDFEAKYDDYDPVINQRIEKYRLLKEQLNSEDEAGKAPRKSRVAAKRKAVVDDDDDDSELESISSPAPSYHSDAHDDDSDIEPIQEVSSRGGIRSSPRKRRRINYAVEDEQQRGNHEFFEAPQQYQQYPESQLQLQPYMDNDFVPAKSIRKYSLSHDFPKDGPLLDKFEHVDSHGLPSLSTEEVDAFLYGSLQRRKSSALSKGPGFYYADSMSPRSTRSPRRPGRVASFASQPVSSSKEFNINDPPSHLVATPTHSARRSSRLASRSI